MKEKNIAVNIDLGNMKKVAEETANACGLDLNEFIYNAIESAVNNRGGRKRGDFVRHGGKHLMGKYTGYEVTEDGRYYPALTWTEQFDELFAARQAVCSLANSVVTASQERLIQIEKQIMSAKNRLIEDLGLDPQKDWTYYGGPKNYVQAQENTESTEGAQENDGADS